MNNFNLDQDPKITGFTIPENYFENFPDKFKERLYVNEPKIIPFFSKAKTLIFAAAAILIVALSLTTINKLSLKPLSIDQTVLENYLAMQGNLNEDDLVNLLDENDINQMNISSDLEDKAIEDALLQNINIEQYITN